MLVAFASALLASCSTSGTDQPFGFATMAQQVVDESSGDFAARTVNSAAADGSPAPAANQFVMDESDPSLPDAVAGAPSLRPMSEAEAQTVAAAQGQQQPVQADVAAYAEAPAAPQEHTLQAQAAAIEAQQKAAQPQQAASSPAPQPAPAQAAPQATPAQEQAIAAATETSPAGDAQGQQTAAAEEPKKRGFLSSFFGASTARAAPQPQPQRPLIQQRADAQAEEPSRPLVQIASAAPVQKPLVSTGPAADGPALPGVRQTSGLFEISRRSGLDDDSDIDLHEDEEDYQVASAAGLARLAPNGLLKQTDNVDVACLKPSLVRVLKSIEQHYGKKVVITSGYRNSERNRQARGARNSLHMYCAAADVQVAGVGKWELAEFVRSMPGRGGVGTYCHTNSVHIDIGPERDWNWRCRRRK